LTLPSVAWACTINLVPSFKSKAYSFFLRPWVLADAQTGQVKVV
jgi:hypothetical protein